MGDPKAMEEKGFIHGKLKLKGKQTKRKTADAKSEIGREKKMEKEEVKTDDTGSEDKDDEVELTEAEAKFLAIRNRFKKRVIEKAASTSFQEQTEKFNERLKSYPLHNDLEGE